MEQLFRRLGLTAKETQTYLKLIQLGAQPVSVVAKHLGIPRASMYFLLEKLRRRHLVEKFERVGVTYFKAIAPKDIASVLHAEERKLQQTLALLKDELPALEKLENTLSITPKVKFSEGKEAVMAMYESILSEREFCASFNPALVKRRMPEYHYRIPEALRENNGRARELLVDCPEAREYKERFHSARHQITILPKDMIFLSDSILCAEKICMITYGEDQIAAIEIFSPTLARTQRAMFDRVWASLS